MDLAQVLSMSTGSTSALVDRLERSCHVRRSRGSTDRRRVHLHYTDTAMALGRDFFGPLGQRSAQVRAQFSDQERAAITRYLDLMNTAMASTAAPSSPVDYPDRYPP